MQSMYEISLVRKLLAQDLYAIERIRDSFATIESPEDFLLTSDGMRRYDSICINLQAMGENLKRVESLTDGVLLSQYPQVPWTNVIKLRDVISHHYFDLDSVIIFEVCRDHLAQVESALRDMLERDDI